LPKKFANKQQKTLVYIGWAAPWEKKSRLALSFDKIGGASGEKKAGLHYLLIR